MPDKIPDASHDCPRCRYWERTAEARPDKVRFEAWPMGIDQAKAVEILNKAFPPKQRRA
jgi:hypothetical protein